MHLGNVAAALVSWLSVKSRGGEWVLRIEDLDPQRSRLEYAKQIEDDLQWLGLQWDEGGVDAPDSTTPYQQSNRSEIYKRYLKQLTADGFTYPCRCTRADIMATQAPHQTDGRIVYSGHCRPQTPPPYPPHNLEERVAVRLYVPDREIHFTDRLYGGKSVNLARHCGDFVVRRADHAWAYQLAVVVDDATMGITEVVRGSDLLLSTAQQIYLFEILGLTPPEYFHIPIVCNEQGLRLSKRDQSLSMETLRKKYTPEELLGRVAHLMGLQSDPTPATLSELSANFSVQKIPHEMAVILQHN